MSSRWSLHSCTLCPCTPAFQKQELPLSSLFCNHVTHLWLRTEINLGSQRKSRASWETYPEGA